MIRDGMTSLTLLFYALRANIWFFVSSAMLLLMSPSWVTSLQIIGIIVAYRVQYMIGVALQCILLLYTLTSSL